MKSGSSLALAFYHFVPNKSSIKNVSVGDREQWIKRSDHAPLIVDLRSVGEGE